MANIPTGPPRKHATPGHTRRSHGIPQAQPRVPDATEKLRVMREVYGTSVQNQVHFLVGFKLGRFTQTQNIDLVAVTQDITHDVWLYALQCLREGKAIKHPATFLGNKARWLVTDMSRQLQRDGGISGALPRPKGASDRDLFELVASPAFDPEANVISAERSQAIERCYGRLSGQQKVAVLDLLSEREIMEILGVSKEKAKNLRFRGRQKLRELFAEEPALAGVVTPKEKPRPAKPR